MSSPFLIVSHTVTVPIQPYQIKNLQQLAPALAKQELQPTQFCHQVGGLPLLLKVQSAGSDSSLLHGGVWAVPLHCNVLVYRPLPDQVVEATCTGPNDQLFTYMKNVTIRVLKPESISPGMWRGKKLQAGQDVKLVVLGYGNCRPLADTTPKPPTNRRLAGDSLKPQPILYARLESDTSDVNDYIIPYGRFEPKPSASALIQELSETQATSMIGKVKVPLKPESIKRPLDEVKEENGVHEEVVLAAEPRKKKKRDKVVELQEDLAILEVNDESKKKKKRHSVVKEEPLELETFTENVVVVKSEPESPVANRKRSQTEPASELAPPSKRKKKSRHGEYFREEIEETIVEEFPTAKSKRVSFIDSTEIMEYVREVVNQDDSGVELDGGEKKRKKKKKEKV